MPSLISSTVGFSDSFFLAGWAADSLCMQTTTPVEKRGGEPADPDQTVCRHLCEGARGDLRPRHQWRGGSHGLVTWTWTATGCDYECDCERVLWPVDEVGGARSCHSVWVSSAANFLVWHQSRGGGDWLTDWTDTMAYWPSWVLLPLWESGKWNEIATLL